MKRLIKFIKELFRPMPDDIKDALQNLELKKDDIRGYGYFDTSR